MSTVPIEAMAVGIPVIAPRVGGVPEIISDRADGRLLGEPFPIQQAAHAVRDVVGSRNRDEEMSRCAQATAERRFSLDTMVHN